jgi:nucleotide-binding universal stress UspA family protein
MADRILVGYDGSEQSRAALAYAVEEWGDADFLLLYVIDPSEAGHAAAGRIPSAAEEWYESAKAEAEETLADAVERVADDVTGEVETATEVGNPPKVIVVAADERDVDHVVIGSHGRTGVTRILLGSGAERIVRKAPVPVTVVR